MKKISLYVFFIVLLFAISGCEGNKFTTTLDGKWEVVKIEEAKGDISVYAPLFFNFQNTVFSIQWFSKETGSFKQGYGILDYQEGKQIFLTLKEAPVSFFPVMKLLQWDKNKCTYQFEKNKRQLKLIDGKTIYHLRKY